VDDRLPKLLELTEVAVQDIDERWICKARIWLDWQLKRCITYPQRS